MIFVVYTMSYLQLTPFIVRRDKDKDKGSHFLFCFVNSVSVDLSNYLYHLSVKVCREVGASFN